MIKKITKAGAVFVAIAAMTKTVAAKGLVLNLKEPAMAMTGPEALNFVGTAMGAVCAVAAVIGTMFLYGYFSSRQR